MDPKPRPSPHSSTRPWIHPFSASAALSPPQCPTQLWSSFPNAAHKSLLSPLPALHTPSHFSPAVFLQECPLFPHPLVYIHIPECCTAWTPERGLMHFQFSSQGYFALHVKCTHTGSVRSETLVPPPPLHQLGLLPAHSEGRNLVSPSGLGAPFTQ